MAFVPFPDVALCELLFEVNGQQCENTLYFVVLGGIEIPTMEDLGGYINTWYTDNVLPYLNASLLYKGNRLTDLTTSTSPVVESLEPVAVAGGITTTGLPNNVAWTLQFKTAARGRSNRGRNYIVGISEASLSDNNTVSTTFAADIVSGYQVLKTDPDIIGTAQWVVASRWNNGVLRTTGQTAPVQSVGYADRTLDSQRRRLPGRGR